MKKIIILLVIAGLVAGYFFFGLDQVLTLANIKARQAELIAWRDSAPVLASVLFFGFYVLVTALSLPGAVLMSLLGAAVFGLVWGGVLVSFASSIGATLAFLVARYLLRDSIQRRYGDRLTSINHGIEKDGPFYLFTLRLIPVFPFFLINILMGLTPLPTFTYYWVSQLGMLPGTLVYMNAGTQLGQITTLKGILSPALLLSFALLGVFPLVAQRLLGYFKRIRVYRGYRKPDRFDANLVVIGAGAAGLVTSYIGAAVKAKVVLVEEHKMGGDCLNYGCVPSKALIRSAKILNYQRHGNRYGLVDQAPNYDFHEVVERVHRVIGKVEPHDSIARYTELGVEVVQGRAIIESPWEVSVAMSDGGRRRITTRAIVIAAGASPYVPDIPGLATSGYVTSETLWERLRDFEEPPRRLAIMGGGPIGCELAQCFARLGSEVTLLDRNSRVMKLEDADVCEFVRKTLENDGVRVLTGTQVISCHEGADGGNLSVENAGSSEEIPYDLLLCAVGRAPRLTGYGLEKLGIPTDKTIVTNGYLETLFPNIYAAGDVVGPYQFTHVAGHHGWYAAVNALFGEWKKFRVDYAAIPRTTFLDPEVARVGLNEQEAQARNIAFELTRYELEDLDRAIADSAGNGFVKILTVPGKDRILGVTIVGAHAGELLAEFVLAVKHGIGLNKILGTVHTYPTLAEANKYAAGVWKKNHAPEKLLPWLERYHAWKRKA